MGLFSSGGAICQLSSPTQTAKAGKGDSGHRQSFTHNLSNHRTTDRQPRKHKPEYSKQVVTYLSAKGNGRKWSGLIKRLLTLVAITTISLSTLTQPVKNTPSQIHNEKPSTVKIAVAEAEKPAEVSPQETIPIAEAEVSPEPVVAQTHTVTGGKTDWLIAAGIPESEWWAVDSIVSRESGWNPEAINPSSGACGLGQQLPCGKWPGAWNDPVAALRAQYQYVVDRYGGYPQAVYFWETGSCATEYGCHWY